MSVPVLERVEQKGSLTTHSAASPQAIVSAQQAIAETIVSSLKGGPSLDGKVVILTQGRPLVVTREQAHKHLLNQAEKGDILAMVHVAQTYCDGKGTSQDYTKAAEWFRKAATNKQSPNAQAMWRLGYLHQIGKGVSMDHQETLRLYEKAANKGLVEAMWDAGQVYDGNLTIKADPEKAKRWFKKAAELGFQHAMTSLAELLLEGRPGIAQDIPVAIKWFRKAAELGNGISMCYLGHLHEYGRGVPKDPKLAEEWYLKAINLKLPEAYSKLATLSYKYKLKTSEEIADLFREGALLGDPRCMYNLGLCLQLGKGVTENKLEALSWFEKAAEEGFPDAIHVTAVLYANARQYDISFKWYQKGAESGHVICMKELGVHYYEGFGVDRDTSLAIHWLRKAAEAGNGDAMYNLAMQSKYTLKDDKEAMLWFAKSAEKGTLLANTQLGLEYMKGQGVPVNHKKAFSFFKQAAAGDDALAMVNLALLYEKGNGTAKDLNKAHEWLHKAAHQKHPEAFYHLARMHENGLGTAKDIDKAKYFYNLATRERPVVAMDALANLFKEDYPDSKGEQWRAMISYRIEHFKDQYTPDS